MVAIVCLASCARTPDEPQGLARAALDNPSFTWSKREASRLRIYFADGSYPASHQDDLMTRVETAYRDDLEMLGVDTFDGVIDVFFIESRAQMDSLVGFPVTGFAERDARAVFLVANPDWRPFERHEIMHVLAYHAWGPANSAWVEEGFAQFADGACGAYSVDDVAHALAEQSGYVPMDTLVARFRELDDLTAYLQAASMMGFLYETRGRSAARAVWQRGVEGLPEDETPAAFADTWWQWVKTRARPVPADTLATIRDKGCGVP